MIGASSAECGMFERYAAEFEDFRAQLGHALEGYPATNPAQRAALSKRIIADLDELSELLKQMEMEAQAQTGKERQVMNKQLITCRKARQQLQHTWRDAKGQADSVDRGALLSGPDRRGAEASIPYSGSYYTLLGGAAQCLGLFEYIAARVWQRSRLLYVGGDAAKKRLDLQFIHDKSILLVSPVSASLSQNWINCAPALDKLRACCFLLCYSQLSSCLPEYCVPHFTAFSYIQLWTRLHGALSHELSQLSDTAVDTAQTNARPVTFHR